MIRIELIFALFYLGFYGIFAQFHNQLNSALFNDLDATCLDRNEIDFNSTVKNATNCIFKPFEEILFKHKWEVSKLQDVIQVVVCKNKVVHKCFKELRDKINPCLFEEPREILIQLHQVVEVFLDSICALETSDFIDAINCTKPNENIPRCKINTKNEFGDHLKDFFTVEKCQKFKITSECQLSAFNQCPDIKKRFGNIFDAIYQASPCN